MTDPSDDDLIDITERGYAVYPRAEEINDSLLEVEFSECLAMAQLEFDSGVQ